MSSDKCVSHATCLVPSKRVKFIIFVLEERYMSTWEAMFTLKWTRCKLKLDHRNSIHVLVKPKQIVTTSHAFSRPWRRLHIFSLSSDWFIGLSRSVVIGQSNYFGFGFTTLN